MPLPLPPAPAPTVIRNLSSILVKAEEVKKSVGTHGGKAMVVLVDYKLGDIHLELLYPAIN